MKIMIKIKLGTRLWINQDRPDYEGFSLNLLNAGGLDIIEKFFLYILYIVFVLIAYSFSYITYSLLFYFSQERRNVI